MSKTTNHMKLVINKCYGGFGLSAKAVKALAKRKGKPCYFFRYVYETHKYVRIEEPDNKSLMWSAFTIPDPNTLPSQRNWVEMSDEEKAASNKAHDAVSLSQLPDDRSDPDLVAVVEKLGSDANGRCAKLEVVEIPDGVSWEIDEYDGLERVVEPIKTWA